MVKDGSGNELAAGFWLAFSGKPLGVVYIIAWNGTNGGEIQLVAIRGKPVFVLLGENGGRYRIDDTAEAAQRAGKGFRINGGIS